jgi:hypothetical protein
MKKSSNYQIITDKYEMHKIAIESSLSEHKDIIHIDFADIRYLCNDMCIKMVIKLFVADTDNEDWLANFKQIIKDTNIPLNKVKAVLLDAISRTEECGHIIDNTAEAIMWLYDNMINPEGLFGVHHNPNLEYDLEFDCMLFFEKDSNEEKENEEIFNEIFAKTQLKFQPKETIKITL